MIDFGNHPIPVVGCVSMDAVTLDVLIEAVGAQPDLEGLKKVPVAALP